MNRHLKVEVRKLKSGRSLFLVPQARSPMRTFLISFRALWRSTRSRYRFLRGEKIVAHRLVGDLSKKLFECHCKERADVVFASRPVVIIILSRSSAHPAVEARMVERCDPLFLKHPVTTCPSRGAASKRVISMRSLSLSLSRRAVNNPPAPPPTIAMRFMTDGSEIIVSRGHL